MNDTLFIELALPFTSHWRLVKDWELVANAGLNNDRIFGRQTTIDRFMKASLLSDLARCGTYSEKNKHVK